MSRNLRLYPWYQAARNLLFWQGLWFLYFEQVLSAEQAIFLAAVADLGAVILEVPSGYFSDIIGRRITLLISAASGIAAYILFFSGNTLAAFIVAQLLWSVSSSFNSGTDSAFLYDTLHAQNRTNETAEAEAQAWLYSYVALALSAATGGLMAIGSTSESYAVAYLMSALAGLAAFVLAWSFTEPPRDEKVHQKRSPTAQLGTVLNRLKDPVLRWMFLFAIALYILSHVPFVFVQPYLRELLTGLGFRSEIPAIAGLVIALMMTVSAILGWYVVSLRNRFGTKCMFGAAMVLQTGLIIVMSYVFHPLVIVLLLLRMVPGAITRPFFLEAIQRRLDSSYRATYLSVQNLAARLFFSGTLFVTATAITGTATLDRASFADILPWFAIAGVFVCGYLWWAWPHTDIKERD